MRYERTPLPGDGHPATRAGHAVPELATGVTRGHFWIIISYADIVNGALTAAVAACKARVPAWLALLREARCQRTSASTAASAAAIRGSRTANSSTPRRATCRCPGAWSSAGR